MSNNFRIGSLASYANLNSSSFVFGDILGLSKSTDYLRLPALEFQIWEQCLGANCCAFVNRYPVVKGFPLRIAVSLSNCPAKCLTQKQRHNVIDLAEPNELGIGYAPSNFMSTHRQKSVSVHCSSKIVQFVFRHELSIA